MAELPIKTIIKKSKGNFEKAWIETATLIPRDTSVSIKQKGTLHPLRECMQECREILSKMGFSEMENRTIISDEDVYKQYGPESPVILDRAFYLAKLPRPDIGLSYDKIHQIESIIGEFDSEILQDILRSYKKGEIEGDDFIEELVKQLDIEMEQATQILSSCFPEFKQLTPQPTNMTLRTHMTGTWYHTLAALQDTSNYPIALFSAGLRYRNEQREDKGHLRVHNSASMVVMDPDMSLEAGKKITRRFLLELGFSDARFERKKATSKYYAKDLEEEVFAEWKGEWLEIGDIGMYSPISLANFGIKYPVFNAGFGIERLTMVTKGYSDIRELVFPQFGALNYSDESAEESLIYIDFPTTERGKNIAGAIEAAVRKNRDAPSPCEFIAYEDDEMVIKVIEKEENKRLVGPATFNEVYIEDGNILSQLEGGENKALFSYIQGISHGMAAKIEEAFEKGQKSGLFRTRMAKTLGDINLQLPRKIKEHMTGEHKKTMVKGPIFLSVTYERK